MNSDLIQRKSSQPTGKLAKMLKDPRLTDATLVQNLYHLAFGALRQMPKSRLRSPSCTRLPPEPRAQRICSGVC